MTWAVQDPGAGEDPRSRRRVPRGSRVRVPRPWPPRRPVPRLGNLQQLPERGSELPAGIRAGPIGTSHYRAAVEDGGRCWDDCPECRVRQGDRRRSRPTAHRYRAVTADLVKQLLLRGVALVGQLNAALAIPASSCGTPRPHHPATVVREVDAVARFAPNEHEFAVTTAAPAQGLRPRHRRRPSRLTSCASVRQPVQLVRQGFGDGTDAAV